MFQNTIRKTKTDYYSNLDIYKKVTNSKKFWKKIKLSSNLKEDTAHGLNTSFSNMVTNLIIPEYTDYDHSVNNISDTILHLIVKYKNHPSILTTGEVCKKSQDFPFRERRYFKGDSEPEHMKKQLKNFFYLALRWHKKLVLSNSSQKG